MADLEGVTIEPKAFAKAIDRIVTDPSLRRELEASPEKALASIGLKITDADRAQMTGKRLSQIVGREAPGGNKGIGQVAETYVHVGVDVAVSAVVGVAVATVMEQVQEEVMRENLLRIQQAARARSRE